MNTALMPHWATLLVLTPRFSSMGFRTYGTSTGVSENIERLPNIRPANSDQARSARCMSFFW